MFVVSATAWSATTRPTRSACSPERRTVGSTTPCRAVTAARRPKPPGGCSAAFSPKFSTAATTKIGACRFINVTTPPITISRKTCVWSERLYGLNRRPALLNLAESTHSFFGNPRLAPHAEGCYAGLTHGGAQKHGARLRRSLLEGHRRRRDDRDLPPLSTQDLCGRQSGGACHRSLQQGLSGREPAGARGRPRIFRLLRRARLESAAADPKAVRRRTARRRTGHLHDPPCRYRRRALDQPQHRAPNRRRLRHQGRTGAVARRARHLQGARLRLFRHAADRAPATEAHQFADYLRRKHVRLRARLDGGCLFVRLAQRGGRGMHLRSLAAEPQGQSVRPAP